MKNVTSKIDKENLRGVIIDFPKQFTEGLRLAKNIRVEGNFEAVEISGMGGSALPANILRIYLNELYLKDPKKNKSFHIFQNRFYSLPHEAYEKTLNIFASYSGNTEETIASFEEAIKNKLPSVGITTGGKLAQLCRQNNIPCVMLPPGIQPRYATGYFFAALLQIFINSGLISDSSTELIAKEKILEKKILELENAGKEIAKKLLGKTPVIYASTKFKSLAMVWKIKINENSKTPAFWNYFSELNHNEMVGFTLPQSQFHIITLLDKDDHPKNIKRMHLTAELLKKRNIDTTLVEMQGTDMFEKIFFTLILGDWVSYYLALEYRQDPTPVAMVEDLKKMLE